MAPSDLPSPSDFRSFFGDLKLALKLPTVPVRYLSWRKVLNYYRVQFAWLMGREQVSARPHYLTLELTNVCNLRCPKCPTGQGRIGRQASMMKLDRLRELVAELGPYAFQIDLHNWGESLLHKEVFEAIRICEDAGVMTSICTNFNVPFDDETAEKMVRSGLSVVSVSIDGPDQETYETYRVKGDLGVVLTNVQTLNRVKERLNLPNPIIIWNYLIFKFNESPAKVSKAAEIAREFGMQFMTARGFSQSDPEWETSQNSVHPVVPLLLAGPACRWLYGMAVINADLGVSPCCIHDAFDRDNDFGDVKEGSFGEVWNGPSYRAARRLFSTLENGESAPDTHTVCEDCFAYTARKLPPNTPFPTL